MKLPFSRFEITGKSMEPSLHNDDRVVTWNWGRLKKNDVVVFLKGGLTMVKRLAERDGKKWLVRGENLTESTDSLDFGGVEERDIVGKVIFRNH